MEKAATSTSSSSATATKKKWFVKRLMSKAAWKWRFLSSGLRWKRLSLQISFFDDVVFKFVSFFEAIVLLSTLCFFYCFCGCSF